MVSKEVKVKEKAPKKKAVKPKVREKVIIKEVVQEVIKKVVKEEYEVVNIPAISKCVICNEHPILEYLGTYDRKQTFRIRCNKCGISVSSENATNLYIPLVKVLKAWINLFAHLQLKETKDE